MEVDSIFICQMKKLQFGKVTGTCWVTESSGSQCGALLPSVPSAAFHFQKFLLEPEYELLPL